MQKLGDGGALMIFQNIPWRLPPECKHPGAALYLSNDVWKAGEQVWHAVHAAFCAVSNKVLYLWPKSLRSSVKIYETLAGKHVGFQIR